MAVISIKVPPIIATSVPSTGIAPGRAVIAPTAAHRRHFLLINSRQISSSDRWAFFFFSFSTRFLTLSLFTWSNGLNNNNRAISPAKTYSVALGDLSRLTQKSTVFEVFLP